MDREMRRQYTVLVDFLGHILGPDYEVALHELKDDSNEIIAIANGELTGRHLGSPLSNKMLEYLTSHLYETQDYVLRFESTAITGKKLCSNSLFIKGPPQRAGGPAVHQLRQQPLSGAVGPGHGPVQQYADPRRPERRPAHRGG